MNETSKEKRKFERKSYQKRIDFSITVVESRVLKMLNLSCDIVDRSAGGIGVKVMYPIEPGHVIRFNDINGSIGYKTGVVRWVIPVDKMYKAGIKFV